jgi:hypothetical protein
LLAFGADAALTLARRVLRGERWWQPHVQHAYQVQARRRGHGTVTAAYFAATLVASAFMIAAKEASPAAMMSATAIAAALACGAWWHLQASPGRDAAGSTVPGRGDDA